MFINPYTFFSSFPTFSISSSNFSISVSFSSHLFSMKQPQLLKHVLISFLTAVEIKVIREIIATTTERKQRSYSKQCIMLSENSFLNGI